MSLIKFLTSKTFLINLGLAVLLFIVAVWGLFRFFDWYTHHGESLTVPDLSGKSVEEAIELIEERGLRYRMADTVYHPEMPADAVVEHNPSPYTQVKQNRRIYLTLNTDEPPTVEVPDLKDVSLRQAMRILQSRGLKVGQLIYEPDIAENVVLAMEANGEEIKEGDEIAQNAHIDLVLGDGLAGSEVEIPDLRGLTLNEARFVLNVSGLNLGNLNYEREYEDPEGATIYRQDPPPPEDEDEKISHGEAIDLYLSKDTAPDEPTDEHDALDDMEEFIEEEDNGF